MRVSVVAAGPQRVHAEVECWSETGTLISSSVAVRLAQWFAEPGSSLAALASGAEFDPSSIILPTGEARAGQRQLTALSRWLLNKQVQQRHSARQLAVL